MYTRYVKRTLDILLSLCGIVALMFPMGLIALAIKIDSKGPVLFKQKRIGIHKSNFYIFKFRTMYADTPKDVPTAELTDSGKWITGIGKILRKTSLDELPQLFNILRGEMSIIGPRPALWNQFDLIKERDKYGVNDVRPGLTGWAQINGRDEIDIEEKSRLDGEYVQKISFIFDCKCFLKTIKSVLKSDGFVEGSCEEFNQNIEKSQKG